MKKILVPMLLSLLMSGCLLDDESSTETNNPGKPITTGQDLSASCSDVTAEQQAVADSLVALANKSAMDDMKDMFDESEWDDAKTHAPAEAHNLYNEALKAAPGHCNALFGKTATSIMLLSQNSDLNSFIDKVEAAEDAESITTGPTSVGSIIHTTPENAPLLLLKTTAAANNADPVTIEEFQEMIEKAILPEVNAAISRLEAIITFPNFKFELKNNEGEADEEIIEFDLGEVGPLLAGMRFLRSYLIIFLAHDLNTTKNGSYDWLDDLSSIDSYDNLSDDQTTALDYMTNFFNRDSKVTSIKPQFADAFAYIPQDLATAMDNLKTGFQYGIDESKSATDTQANDPYRVGTGAEDDINPADLQVAIDQMDHFKKYFTGEVAVSYSKGTKTLQVNLNKFFQRTGNMQQFLPYFEFNPYSMWDDTIRVDTAWQDPETSHYFEYYTSCRTKLVDDVLEYQCSYQDEPSDYSYFRAFDFCKESSESVSGYLCADRWGVDQVIAGPFYFTNASGVKTYSSADDNFNAEPKDLKGKVIFPDPTFGGIFPNLTNDNIFDYIQSLEDVSPYDAYSCEETETYDEEYGWYRYERTCNVNPLPKNPSDLDRLLFVFVTFLID